MHHIRSFMRSTPFFLAVIAGVTYGFLVPWLGFYWDDWTFAFLAHNFGPAELIPAFASFRPFLGVIFYTTLSLLGTSPLAWQIFGVGVRFVLALALWWSLKQLWPNHKKQILTATLIFLVFPGFSQQWVALTHINQEIIPLIAYLFSFGFTILAIRNPGRRIRNVVFSVLLQFVGLFSTEYFFGYELIRLTVIFLLVDPGRLFVRLRRTFLYWLPNAVLWIGNAIWLFLYYRSGAYSSYGIQGPALLAQNPLQAAVQLFTEALRTISTAALSAWSQAFKVFQLPILNASFLITIVLVIASFAFIAFYRLRVNVHRDNQDHDHDTWALQAILLGVISILVGRLPSWVAGLPFELRFDYDRFFLSIMLGASLLLAGVVNYFFKSTRRKIFATSLFIALAVGGQFLYANEYRRDANNQKDLFTQLTWRIPGIKPNTILLTDKIVDTPHESDLGLTAPLNWIYAPKLTDHQLPYLLFYTDIRLATNELPGLMPEMRVEIKYRTTRFSGNTSDAIVFYVPDVGCLKVIDPSNSAMIQKDVLREDLLPAVQLSNLSRIDVSASPKKLPAQVFGDDAKKTWCYYYQKAELASQMQNWEQVVQLAEEAEGRGFEPDDPLERLVFIEAYLKTGRLDQAEAVLSESFKSDPILNQTVNLFLEQLINEGPSHNSGKKHSNFAGYLST